MVNNRNFRNDDYFFRSFCSIPRKIRIELKNYMLKLHSGIIFLSNEMLNETFYQHLLNKNIYIYIFTDKKKKKKTWQIILAMFKI